MQNSCAISQADELAAFLQGSVRQNFLYQGCDVKIPDEILLGSATCLEIATQLLPALRLAITLSAKQRDWIRSSLARVQATPSRMVTLTSMACAFDDVLPAVEHDARRALAIDPALAEPCLSRYQRQLASTSSASPDKQRHPHASCCPESASAWRCLAPSRWGSPGTCRGPSCSR